jgi:hypothetical protein
MSARDKFWAERVSQNISYVKFNTVNLPDIRFLVSSSSTNTILHVLPTSSAGIRFYTINNSEITPTTQMNIQPNSAPQIIVARIGTEGFDQRAANTRLDFPIRFVLDETIVPPASTPPASGGFVCIPCFQDETVNRAGGCPPGQECRRIGGQTCCVDVNDDRGGREEVE